MQNLASQASVIVQVVILISRLPYSFQSPHCYISMKSENRTTCELDYFPFPNIWNDSDSKDLSVRNQDKEQILCCPTATEKTRVDDKQFWWPNEVHRGLSRAIVNCHPSSIPGMETIRFLYYTNNNHDPDDYNEIFVGSRKSIKVSRFVKDAPLKIVIHGFMSSPFVGPAKALRAAYAQLPKAINIIAVQWEALANLVTASDSICYNIAAQSTKLVGKRTAELIEFLVAEKMVTLANVHVLGHSLGAHCAGFTGKFLSIGKLPRITGFDPARPNFENVNSRERIHHTDAEFIDIIHTATRDWKLLGLVSLGLIPFPVGLQQPVGHADFYPNRGSNQPGCTFAAPSIPVLCSHARSYMYYAESITYLDGSRQFVARECLHYYQIDKGACNGETSVPMGEYTPLNNNSRKLYFLTTNKHSPYVVVDDEVFDDFEQ